MSYIVYKLTSPSEKVYIGITCQPIKKRWMNGHGYKKCPAIYKAINKYGWENFQKEILYEGLSEEHAKYLETYLINAYKSKDKRYGYNLTQGGDGTSGRTQSEETRKKISEKNKGKKISEEQKERLRQINLGKHHSEETKRKMSNTHKGNKYNLGRKLSEEHKHKIGEKGKGSKNPRSRRVICLETLKVYDTMIQARTETGATKISDCCNHNPKHKSSNGLHWEYYDETLSSQDYKDILDRLIKEEYKNKHRKLSEGEKQMIIERSSVSVVCVETGEVFSSIRNACKKYEISPSAICNCCKGNAKTAKGFHWKYAN